MNILEQEDFVKGLPDEVLVEEAQAPTGNIPQYLVVSEIQRREKMRSKFDEQVPQETVTDQIISGGIAAMNPNPDPLMSMAMGAPDPMMGQDPMMRAPMQDPMMGQMQDPMMGQMPQDLAMGQQMPQDPMMQMPMQDPMMQPPMQDPMMQQGMMAAGGGMMPYRMDQGRETPFPLEYKITDLGGGSYLNEGGVYPRGRRGDAGDPVLNRMGNQVMYAEGDSERSTILAALGRDVGVGGGVQGVIDRAVRNGLSQEHIPELIAGALRLRTPPDIRELKQSLEAHGYYVPSLDELAAEYSGPQKAFAGSLSEEENSGIDAARLAQSSVKPSIYSTALRDDVSRFAKPKLGEAGFLEDFDPELARLIAAPEAGSVKVNPRVAAKQEAEAEQLDALNVLEELGSARYEIQRGDTLSGIAQDHGTTVEALALANKISNPDMIYAGETLEMAADGGMMPYRMASVGEVPSGRPHTPGLLGKTANYFESRKREVYQQMIDDLLIRGAPYEGADLRRFESLGRQFPEMRENLAAQGILPPAPAQGGVSSTAATEVLPVVNKKPSLVPEVASELVPGGAEPKGPFSSGAPLLTLADLAGDQGASTPALRGYTGKELNFANLDTLMNQAPIDYYGKFKVDYTDLLAKEETRSKLAAEQARRDAASNALIQLGAGIAGGDMAGGISKAGEVAMLSKKEAREEEKGLTTLQRQIELADRQQKSTLGIKGAEAGREQKMALAKFGLEKQQAAIQSDENVYAAYIKMKTLEQAMMEAPTDEERAAALAYKKSQTVYMDAFANSRVYDTAFTEESLQAYITQAMSTPEGYRKLSGMSDPEQKDWARREMIMSGGVPSMIPGATGATGYSEGVLVAGGG